MIPRPGFEFFPLKSCECPADLEWIIFQVHCEHLRIGATCMPKLPESYSIYTQRRILPAPGNHLCTLIPVLLIFFAFVSYFCFFLSQLFPAFLPPFFQLLIPQEFQVIDNGYFNNWIKGGMIRGCLREVGDESKRQNSWPENQGNNFSYTGPSTGGLTTALITKLPHT